MSSSYDAAKNFECRFRRWWDNFRMEIARGNAEDAKDTEPVEFAEYALEMAEDEEVEYPRVLLKRKKELEAA